MDLSDVLSLVVSAYGSLESPNFEFVWRAVSLQPYKTIIESFANEGVIVTDDTDINDDVAFSFLMEDSHYQLFLQLSMIGPLAVLQRVGPDGTNELIQAGVTELNQFEELIVNRLSSAGMHFLSVEVLSAPVNLALANAEQQFVTVYQAVFTDRDTLPWSRVAK